MNSSSLISLEEALKRITSLEDRIENLESKVAGSFRSVTEEETEEHFPEFKIKPNTENLELKIGENWFAKIGILIFLLGSMILLTRDYEFIPSGFVPVIGYLIAVTLFIIAKIFKNSFKLIEGYLVGGGLVLLFFATFRLHFFTDTPIIDNNIFFYLLLFAALSVSLAISVIRNSAPLLNVSFLMSVVFAISINSQVLTILAAFFIAASGAYYFIKLKSYPVLLFTIVLVYFTHLVGNLYDPLIGKLSSLSQFGALNTALIPLFLFLLSLAIMFRDEESKREKLVVIFSFINLLIGYSLLLVITLVDKLAPFGIYHVISALIFMSIAILYWVREQNRYTTFLFAMFAYLALSVSIFKFFDTPSNLIWLCWQSLIVVSTAIWFKSKYIVLANFAIYILLILSTVLFAGSIEIVGLHFGIVALLSARILNWKRERLELKTEQMRNAYLLTALIMLPLSFYFILPKEFITAVLIGLALMYYALSKLLNTLKYRWMAIITLIISITYVIILGITTDDETLRLISFLSLGIVLVGVSLWYNKSKPKNPSTDLSNTEAKL